jgi:hypothetical protein
MPRKSTWTNADGLVVGFGPNSAERTAQVTENNIGPIKEAAVAFDFSMLNTTAAGSVAWTAPAGTNVVSVTLEVNEAFVGGTSVEFGDASDTDGFITAAQGATANLLAGAKIVGSGLYTKGATDTVAQEFKVYASATTLSMLRVGTFTAGKGVLKIAYI